MIWADTKEECIEKAWYFLEPMVTASGLAADNFVKSLTFIGGSIYDNKELLKVNPEYLSNLASQDEDTRRQLLDGNWKVSVNPMDVYNYTTFKDYFTNTWVKEGEKTITVDVAMEGKNKLIISYFNSNRWEDLKIMSKSNGKAVFDAIKAMQNKHGVPNSRVVYDADGVGAFIGGDEGFIPGSYAFHNGSKSLSLDSKREFKNLKAQCYILDGEDVNQFITEEVANMMYDDNMTVRQRLLHERKAIKKQPKRDEEKEGLIPKKEMKEKYLSGESPDLLDGFMMKRALSINNKKSISKFIVVKEIPEEAIMVAYGLCFNQSKSMFIRGLYPKQIAIR